MGYKEEIYERAERQFSNMGQMYAWLTGFDKPKKNAYEKAGLDLAKDVGNYVEVEDNIFRTEEYEELDKLKRYAEAIEFKPLRDKILPKIEKKMDKVGKELKELTEKRREDRLEQEAIEKEEKRIAERIARQQEAEEAKKAKEELRAQGIEPALTGRKVNK